MKDAQLILWSIVGLILGSMPSLVSDVSEPVGVFGIVGGMLLGFAAGFGIEQATKYENRYKELDSEHSRFQAEAWKEEDKMQNRIDELEAEVEKYEQRTMKAAEIALKFGAGLFTSGLSSLFPDEYEEPSEPENEEPTED
jgi:Skp family chaperone for outer membrane proteins